LGKGYGIEKLILMFLALIERVIMRLAANLKVRNRKELRWEG
jgi:hypothetical protein